MKGERIMENFERFIEAGRECEFAELLKRSDAKIKGYFKRTSWDDETEKGFIINVDTKDDPVHHRRRDYFIVAEKIDGKMRIGKMEILADEVLHDYAVQCATERRGGGIANTAVMGSLATSEKFELLNEDTDFYDFVKCFCK